MERDTTVIEEIRGTEGTGESVRIAIEGCCHGELEAIYGRLQRHEHESGCRPIDLLICCGDFQSLRNLADLHSIAVPEKYRSMGSFYKYYSGELLAPYPTIFVSGNHEASQPLHELYYGGWVAPKIYYMGAAGVVRFCGLRIGGISGIFKGHDYNLGQHERPPYDRSSIRSIYHVRSLSVHRMLCLAQHASQRLDVVVSHDWPQGIEQHGNTQALLKRKPHFRSDVEQNCLGSPPNWEVLLALKPKWWFSAHLHIKFRATVHHTGNRGSSPAAKGSGESRSASDDGKVTSIDPSSTICSDSRKRKAQEAEDAETLKAKSENKEKPSHSVVVPEQAQQCVPVGVEDQMMTQFLSLDKCLPRRHFLTVIDVPVLARQKNPKLEYDLEWLAILRKTHHLSTTSPNRVELPDDLASVDDDDVCWVRSRLGDSLHIPENFAQTVPPIAQGGSMERVPKSLPPPLQQMGNPQTDALLGLLEMDHVVTVPYTTQTPLQGDDNEIDLGDDED